MRSNVDCVCEVPAVDCVLFKAVFERCFLQSFKLWAVNAVA